MFAAIADPRRPLKAPAVERRAAGDQLRAARERGQARCAQRPTATRKGARRRARALAAHADVLRAVNARLIQSERQLTDAAGLPRRPWYRHLLYAPGFYTGYAVKTMPGVREAIEQKQYAEAEAEVVRVARALDRETALIEAAAAALERVR